MKQLWLHRYSAASFGLSIANFLISFWVMSPRYCRAPSELWSTFQGALGWSPIWLGLLSTTLAAVALAKEHPKLYGFAAVGVSVPTFMLCLMHHAV